MSELTNKPRSSYARLFDTGNNDELSKQIGELFTHFQSQTIKQGNELEEYICEYINNTNLKLVKEKKAWYKSKENLSEIFVCDEKYIANKCFIPKKYFDEYNIPCGNSTGVELDFVFINNNKIYLVEMKAGKDFDTKKSKGEVDNLMNIKKLLELNNLPYEDAFIISYEANTIQNINIKTDIKDCKLLVFESFLELIFENNNSEINNGIEYIKNKFRNKAFDNIKHFNLKCKFLIDALNNDELNADAEMRKVVKDHRLALEDADERLNTERRRRQELQEKLIQQDEAHRQEIQTLNASNAALQRKAEQAIKLYCSK